MTWAGTPYSVSARARSLACNDQKREPAEINSGVRNFERYRAYERAGDGAELGGGLVSRRAAAETRTSPRIRSRSAMAMPYSSLIESMNERTSGRETKFESAIEGCAASRHPASRSDERNFAARGFTWRGSRRI